jgi:hypothetical protein
MAMIRPLFFLIIQRAGVGEGVPVCTPPGVKATLSILARRMFWIFAKSATSPKPIAIASMSRITFFDTPGSEFTPNYGCRSFRRKSSSGN